MLRGGTQLALSLRMPHDAKQLSHSPMMRIVRTTAGLALATAMGLGSLGAAAADPALQSIESIARAAEQTVRESLPAPGRANPAPTIHVVAGSLDRRLRLSACTVPLIGAVAAGGGLRHRTVVRVSCGGAAPWNVQLPVSIESEFNVLLLERALPRGATPSGSDLRSTRRRVPGLPLSYVQEPAELRNRQLRRPLEAGTALQFDALEPAPVIRRGQAVTLITDAEGLEVRAPGEALSDAAPGQRVRIRNLASLKVIEGRADEAGTVRVGP